MTNNKQFRSLCFTSSIALLLGIGIISCSTSVKDWSKSNQAEPVSQTTSPLGFSVEKMDTSVDPKQDFHRFTAGKWLDNTKIPPDKLMVDGLSLLNDRVSQQLQQITAQAATQSTTAPKGSPLQQVGDLYAGGMDVKRLESLGVSPLKPIFDRIAAIDSLPALAKTLPQLQMTLSEPIILGVGVTGDLEDATTNIIGVSGGKLTLSSQEDYLSPDKAAIRQAYLDYVAAALEIAGSSSAEATAAAKKILEMETRIASKQLSPTEKRDFKKAITKMSVCPTSVFVVEFRHEDIFSGVGITYDRKYLSWGFWFIGRLEPNAEGIFAR